MRVLIFILAHVFLLTSVFLSQAKATEAPLIEDTVSGWDIDCYPSGNCLMSRVSEKFKTPGGGKMVMMAKIGNGALNVFFGNTNWRVHTGSEYKGLLFLDSNNTEPVGELTCLGLNFNYAGGYDCGFNLNFENLNALRTRRNVGVYFQDSKHMGWIDLTGSAAALDRLLDLQGRLTPKMKGIEG